MSEEDNKQEEINQINSAASSNSDSSLAGVEENGTKLPIEFLNDVPMKLTVELGVGDNSLESYYNLYVEQFLS